MKITYIPGYGDPAHVTWCGIEFTANKPVDVVEERILRKAQGNPFFESESEAPPAADASFAEAAGLLAQMDDIHWKTFQAEARRIIGADAPTTKNELVAALQALAPPAGA
ncbi:hypothetical protein [Xanthobacter sp. VNH20]|uniref:hypothetical protein n=1 Tax=Xanthobacter sp. VNH20 TaxID=3156616 RepID=UPI0032B56088